MLANVVAPAGVLDGILSNPAITVEMWPATWQTLAMTALSSLFTVVLGVPLGLILVGTAKGGLFPNKGVNQVLGTIVNIGRSFPFVILVVAIIPFTRLLAGTSLGWQAAIVPLTVGAVPFFARLVESNISGVDAGKIEAAKMMGASRLQIMKDVQLAEALPALVQSVTVTIITLIGYSAITGTVGGGGLGFLAVSYGYNRFDGTVMAVAVLVIIVMVEIIQRMGDMLSRLVDHR
ncbi:MAG: methionine ABC transporter permease [Actinomycetaceae bacterium]|nr:methionine ABC transporter permease [Actinomycetaceae bacterium]